MNGTPFLHLDSYPLESFLRIQIDYPVALNM